MVENSTRSGSQRRTKHINRKPASNLHHAIRIAEVISLPLNWFVTVDLTSLGGSEDDASNIFQQLRQRRFDPWIRRGKPGCSPTHCWVIENTGIVALHWLVHIPRGRVTDFSRHLRDWLAEVSGGVLVADTVDIRPAETPRAAGRYMLKGIDPTFASFYGVYHRPQGIVRGKRSGFTRNLGPKRKKELQAEGRYRVGKASVAMVRTARHIAPSSAATL
jgi:hypothetical protein